MTASSMDGSSDCDAVGNQALLQVGRLVDAHDGVHAVHLAEAVVGPGQVVQVDRAPEP